MNLLESTNDFEQHLRAADISGRTAAAYVRDAELFLDYVHHKCGGETSSQAVKAWLDQLVAEGYAPATIARQAATGGRLRGPCGGNPEQERGAATSNTKLEARVQPGRITSAGASRLGRARSAPYLKPRRVRKDLTTYRVHLVVGRAHTVR